MLLERYLMNYVENNPQEMKNLLLVLCRRLSCAEKQELIKEFLGEELFEALQWCVECRKNILDFAKITKNEELVLGDKDKNNNDQLTQKDSQLQIILDNEDKGGDELTGWHTDDKGLVKIK